MLSELDAKLVAALGLSDAARRIRIAVRDADLSPTSHVGNETVARLLGLRVNHPQGEEYLELAPSEPANRAEAAYSLVRSLSVTPARKAEIRRLAAALQIPQLTGGQHSVLARALRFVGYPYVWAGSSERVQQLYYGMAPGGFDCSGFVWRVYKLQPFADAPLLGASIRGRTTFSMSAEMRKADRIASRRTPTGRLRFLRGAGPGFDAPGGRPHGDRRCSGVVRALLRERGDAAAAPGLVSLAVRVGAAAAAGGRAVVTAQVSDPLARIRDAQHP